MILGKGSENAGVKNLQKNLVQLGLNIEVDGKFDDQTETALNLFQEGHGLKATGELDPITHKVMARAIVGQIPDSIHRKTPWMDKARAAIASIEKLGNEDKHKEYLHHLDYRSVDGESGYGLISRSLIAAGQKDPGVSKAEDFERYGVKIDLSPGSIGIFKVGNSSQVAFIDHTIGKTHIAGIIDASGDRARLAIFLRKNLVACRWPVK